MLGFFGRVLHIDLSSRTWTVAEVPDQVLAQYLGGKGLAAHLLLEHAPPGVDALAPANPFIIATGPASSSGLPPASRYGLFSKSPQTGIFAESYAGGHIAPRIKATGYDAIVLRGTSEQPAFLEISDEGVAFHDAAPFWGLDAYEAEAALEQAVGKEARAIVIGPAGERGVVFACVGNDRGRQAGRTGLGAVLGSKRVKGLVFHGRAECPLFDPSGVRAYTRYLLEKGREDPSARNYRTYGTPMVVAIANRAGAFPSSYGSAGTVPHWER